MNAKQKSFQKEDQSIYGIDLFLRCLYDYWLHGGMSFLVARKVTALLKTLTLFAIVIVVLYCIDYDALLSLSLGETSVNAILHAPQMTWFSITWIVCSSVYFCYNVWKTINQLQQARNIRQFYRYNLNVPNDEALFWMPWSAVCRRLRTFQYKQWLQEKNSTINHHQHSSASSSEQMTSPQTIEKNHFKEQLFENVGGRSQNGSRANLQEENYGVAEFEYEAMLTDDNIATMIMRRENYWIALFADNVLAFQGEEEAEDGRKDDENNSEFPTAFHNISQQQQEQQQEEQQEDKEESVENGIRDEMDELLQRKKPTNRFYFGNAVPTGSSLISSLWRASKHYLMASLVRPLFVTECDDNRDNCIIEKPILTKTLQWCLTYGLFGFAIDSQTGALKHELTLFVQDCNTFAERERKRSDTMFRSAAEWHRTSVSQPLTNKLIWRFRAMAIIGAVLSPFIFVLVLLSFFFEHGDEVRNEPGRSLGTRQWTNEARWAFRQYNELPHLFEARLARGALAAQQYVDSFLFSTHGEYARCVSFIAAAALFVFLLLGAIGDEEALSLVQFALHRSAFWWITALSLLIAAARSMVPSIETVRHETLRRGDNDTQLSDNNNDNDNSQDDKEQENTEHLQFDVNDEEKDAWQYLKPKHQSNNLFNAVPNEFLPTPTPQELCYAVAHYTHYYPQSWQRKEHTESVRQRFFCLFDAKWLIYLREIFGILYTPYLLWFVFPQKAQKFLDFFVERTERQHKVGHVCAREKTAAVNASESV